MNRPQRTHYLRLDRSGWTLCGLEVAGKLTTTTLPEISCKVCLSMLEHQPPHVAPEDRRRATWRKSKARPKTSRSAQQGDVRHAAPAAEEDMVLPTLGNGTPERRKLILEVLEKMRNEGTL